MSIKNNKIFSFSLFLLIFVLAAYFRLHGVNWDYNQHLHPDERFLTMVTGAIVWPKNLNEYLNAEISPLNPHNKGFNFFVYGTFPIFFTKYIADIANSADYNGITLTGRRLSALFDLGTVVLVFLIVKQLKTKSIPYIAMFFYAALVLPIQLSHFYAVDTYLTFFTTLSFYFLIKIFKGYKPLFSALLLGISLGLSLASKISAVYFFPIIALGLLASLFKTKKIITFLVVCIIVAFSCFLTLRLAQPYLFATPDWISFKLNPKILNNWKELKSFDDPNSYFPPSVQWIKTKAFIFPLKNYLFWGAGLPLGLISVFAVFYYLLQLIPIIIKRQFKNFLQTETLFLTLSLIWILFLFAYQGGQFVKALRYFFVLYPFLAILASMFTFKIFLSSLKNRPLYPFLIFAFVITLLIYPLSFTSIYSRENSRIAASRWIYQYIPEGSIISGETWDDGLPMSLPDAPGLIHEKYKKIEFPLYNFDNQDKWQKLNQSLHQIEYIIMSSNRLYGSIMTVPEKYPTTYKFYNMLFDGTLGFEKVAEFTSRPNLDLPFINLCLTPPFIRYGIVALKSQECPLPGISFVDDYADETFTVYDHPKVVIFKKVKSLDYLNLLPGEKI